MYEQQVAFDWWASVALKAYNSGDGHEFRFSQDAGVWLAANHVLFPTVSLHLKFKLAFKHPKENGVNKLSDKRNNNSEENSQQGWRSRTLFPLGKGTEARADALLSPAEVSSPLDRNYPSRGKVGSVPHCSNYPDSALWWGGKNMSSLYLGLVTGHWWLDSGGTSEPIFISTAD